MPQYLCITGGLKMNGKKYSAGQEYTFETNPAEEHFVVVRKTAEETVEKKKRK